MVALCYIVCFLVKTPPQEVTIDMVLLGWNRGGGWRFWIGCRIWLVDETMGLAGMNWFGGSVLAVGNQNNSNAVIILLLLFWFLLAVLKSAPTVLVLWWVAC